MSDQTNFFLNESDMPRFWYNINAGITKSENTCIIKKRRDGSRLLC